MRHVELQIAHARRMRPGEEPQACERAAVRELRSHLLWYTRGRRGGVHLRRDAAALQTAADVAAAIERHFPPGGTGFEADPDARPPAAGAEA
jgi:tRNA-dihydrouridine synthase